ncbi:UPF0172-domain-containing protein [Exidia glandulosa HHB12029]|uniref:UPF0172-domain-containing protein n=1 Tax=Exidia glandulosa HHB12029 TaxID=1314781 RepID=A0A165ZQG4_EXIGL|nr:UPF0172-domain-containing protein [Exidia glandulosa HHB12029]
MSYVISHQAYIKIVFHAAQHPHKPVNGVLLGRSTGSSVDVVDTIPLLHHWTSLSPSMEIGLDLAYGHAESEQLTVVGYYQATERTDDNALAPVGERVASKIKERFAQAIALVIDGQTLGSGSVALIPYVSSGSSWRKDAWAAPRYALASPASPARALALIRDNGAHRALADFDDHLEDVALDWLRNPDAVDPDPPK